MTWDGILRQQWKEAKISPTLTPLFEVERLDLEAEEAEARWEKASTREVRKEESSVVVAEQRWVMKAA